MSGIGKEIKRIREEEGVSQEKLTRGLCSRSTLSKLEWEERYVEQWIIEAILQRLGKSSDKFWTIINVKDYYMLEERNKIWEDILNKKYAEAERGLESYRKRVNMQEPLQHQFVLKCQGMLLGKAGNWRRSIAVITQAIQTTVCEFEVGNVENLFLGRDEMLLILLLVEGYEQVGKKWEVRQLVYGLLKNIENKNWDSEELVKIYPKVVWYWVRFLKEEDKHEMVIFVAGRAVELLKENEVVFLMADLMSGIMWGIKRRGEKEERELTRKERYEYERLKRQVEVLEEIWEEYGTIPRENVIYCTNIQKDISASNELIRKARKNCGFSQEALSDAICTTENLSRIENGGISPEEKNYRSLMEKMHQAVERNRGIINVPDYKLREELRMVSKYASQMEYDKAQRIWRKLSGKIPRNSKENRQCILRYDTLISYGKKEIGWKEATRRYESALRETMPRFKQIDIAEWPLTRTEIFLLNNIASGYYSMGKRQEAKQILDSLKRAFDSSAVSISYRITEYMVLLYNMAMVEKMEGNMQQAKELFEEGVRLQLQAGRLTKVAKLLYSLGWVMQEKREDEKARKRIKQAFHLSDITNLPNMNNDIYNYWQKNWKDSILN